MKHSSRAAFSLVELLVVIAVICLLVALLLPATGSAWHAVYSTQCQTNLATLWKAQCTWASERISAPTTRQTANVDDEWCGKVSTYLEGGAGLLALKCPLGITTNSDTSTPLPGGQGGTETAVSLEDITIGCLDNNNNLVYEFPLSDNSHWTFYQTWDMGQGQVHIGAQIDSYFPTAPANHPNMKVRPAIPAGNYYTDEDFTFTATFSASGVLTALKLGDCDGNGDQYYTDMRVCGKPLWNGQKFMSPFGAGHFGENIDLGAGLPHSATWTMYSGAGGVLAQMNYGISRGCFKDRSGKDMKVPDPKLIFLLDYPRAVADFTTLSDNAIQDNLHAADIFIWPTPPTAWTPPSRMETLTWQQVQALRHGGRANVLFCDGHVDSLAKEDLAASSLLWWTTGK